MELKLSKRLVFTSMEFKNGNPKGLQFIEKEGYFLTKEELERVIGDACDTNFQNKVQESCGVLSYETLKQEYIKSILK